jgi:hypothetical protein
MWNASLQLLQALTHTKWLGHGLYKQENQTNLQTERKRTNEKNEQSKRYVLENKARQITGKKLGNPRT